MNSKITMIDVVNDGDGDPIVFALCEDGSVWKYGYFKSGMRWAQIPNIDRDSVAITSQRDAEQFAKNWNAIAGDEKIEFIAKERTGEWIGFCGHPTLNGEYWEAGKIKSIRLHELQGGQEPFWKKSLTRIGA